MLALNLTTSLWGDLIVYSSSFSSSSSPSLSDVSDEPDEDAEDEEEESESVRRLVAFERL